MLSKKEERWNQDSQFLIYHALREYGRINKIGLHLIKETASGDFVLQQFRFRKGSLALLTVSLLNSCYVENIRTF
jgi:hypothetical protein